MKYVITEVNKQQGWVALTVTFDDNSTYDKRMMAPMDSEESIHGAIKQWLADYLPMREKKLSSYDPKGLENKTTNFTKQDLPTPSSALVEEVA